MSGPIDALRAARAGIRPAPEGLERYLDDVRVRAFAITDDQVRALREAGHGDDEIFEQTVGAAVDEGLRRLDAALRAIDG